ncbi:MAG: response regulator [Planctomycetes bacterium]|nr:response regulator [Planctomycetota bacterium]
MSDRYQKVFEQAGAGMLMLDLEGRIVDFNPAASRLMGRARGSMLDRPFESYLQPRYRRVFRERLKLLEQLGHLLLDARLGESDGAGPEVVLDASLVPWKDEQSVLVVLRELARREHQDQEAQWLRRALEARSGRARRWVYRADREGQLHPLAGSASAVPAWAAALAALPEARLALEGALEGKSSEAPARWWRTDEQEAARPERWIALAFWPVAGEHGVVDDVLAVAEDRTFARLADEEGRRQQLRGAVALFNVTLVNEFNNYLGAIMAQASVLRLSATGGRLAPPAVGAILDAAEEAAALLRRCAEVGQPGSAESQTVDLNAVAADAVTLLRHQMGGRMEIRLDASEPAPPVRGDAGLLGAMILALGRMASFAMPAGGTLQVRTYAVESSSPAAPPGAGLEIADSGVGLDPVVRAEAQKGLVPSPAAGLGDPLDLAIARAVIRRHRGQYELESVPGRGTTWRIELPGEEARPFQSAPLPAARLPADSGEAERPLPPASRPVSDGEPSELPSVRSGSGEEGSDGTWVLLADDEEIFRDFVRQVLQQNGYDVAMASDGREAAELFQEAPERYALAVLDAYMPRMGGLEAYLRMQALRPELPVLFVSGFVRGPSRQALLAACPGRAEVILKPFSEERLLDAVEHILRKKPKG